MKTLNDIQNILPEPIVIEVVNNSGATRNNIRLFGGYTYTAASATPFPGVTIRSGLSGITYGQTVNSTQSNPLKIGMIGFASLPGKPGVVPTLSNSLRFAKASITRSGSSKTVVMRDDPYAVKAMVYSPIDFTIDNESAIFLGRIRAGEIVQLYMFPAIPEMKQVTFPDVKAGIIRMSNNMYASGETDGFNQGHPKYMTYRLVGGTILAAAVVGLCYWVGKELKVKK